MRTFSDEPFGKFVLAADRDDPPLGRANSAAKGLATSVTTEKGQLARFCHLFKNFAPLIHSMRVDQLGSADMLASLRFKPGQVSTK